MVTTSALSNQRARGPIARPLQHCCGVKRDLRMCVYFLPSTPSLLRVRPSPLTAATWQVIDLFGEPMKSFGMDSGSRREGRRNFLAQTQYKVEEDESQRTRIRFNVEGPRGRGAVYAEVCSLSPARHSLAVRHWQQRYKKVHMWSRSRDSRYGFGRRVGGWCRGIYRKSNRRAKT